jgi:hypothetical protein
VENLDKYSHRWQDQNRRRADHHLYWPEKPYREDQSILVAGCGTSQAAKYALRWQNSALRLSCFEADWFGTTPCVTETTTPVTRSRLTLRSKIGLILYPFACPARFLFRSGYLLGLQLF